MFGCGRRRPRCGPGPGSRRGRRCGRETSCREGRRNQVINFLRHNCGGIRGGRPGRCSPDRRSPDRGSCDKGSPKRGSCDRGSPKRGSCDRGSPKRGSCDRGSPKRGSCDRGSPDRVSPKRGCDRRRGGRRGRGGRGGRRPPCGGNRRPGRGHCIRFFTYGGGCRDKNEGQTDENEEGQMQGVEISKGGQEKDSGQQQTTQKDIVIKPDVKILKVKSVDFCFDKNGEDHHTDRYEICGDDQKERKLVVRRGQQFDIEITFSRKYDPEEDDLRLIFEIGNSPNTSKGTYVDFVLSDEDKPNEWGGKIVSNKDKQVRLQIFTPADMYIGKWDLSIEVVKADDTSVDIFKYEHETPIYFIFNPWCKEDSTYFEQTELLEEYILNESGRVYTGSKTNITSKPWNFGQFESCVLEVAFFLLEEAGLSIPVRGNPIPVVRKISAIVNSNDDDGVLTGNWSGEYGDGRSPLSWTGSVAILEDYWQNMAPVNYGQCWVFSAVCTTICRALGIPTRSVTCYASAHDTDGSVTIDSYLTADGEPDRSMSDDSVWNFHVWNEAWMSRPDLPKGYGGWQVVDSTPQETSEGVFCCGPVSVQAIRQGELNLPFDASFVFAEVNADRMCWMPDTRGKMQCVASQKSAVGKFISTKDPKSNDRLDLTNEYKPEEGSTEERASVLKANQTGSTRGDIYEQEEEDVKFSIDQEASKNKMGGCFDAKLVVKNTSKEKRTVSGRLTVSVMYYTGIVGEEIKSVPFEDLVLGAGQEGSECVSIRPSDYDGRLLDGAILDVNVFAYVEETCQVFVTREDFLLNKPHLSITAPEKVKKGEEFQIDVSFTNPLDTPLTNCYIIVDGLAKELKFPQGKVPANGEFKATLPITPKKKGKKELILNFNSKQIEDVNGCVPIVVQRRKKDKKKEDKKKEDKKKEEKRKEEKKKEEKKKEESEEEESEEEEGQTKDEGQKCTK